MSLSKYSVPAMIALALAAPVLVGMQSNSVRPAEAETAAVKLPPQPAAPAPSTPAAYSPHSATLRMEDDGHYWATARVNTTEVRFLVDTGASFIALTKQDARRIGVLTRASGPVAHVSTAHGSITVPIVTLKRVRIGNVEVSDVRAVVIEEGLDTSLLGMSFLGELKTWQTTPAGLVLKQ